VRLLAGSALVQDVTMEEHSYFVRSALAQGAIMNELDY